MRTNKVFLLYTEWTSLRLSYWRNS